MITEQQIRDAVKLANELVPIILKKEPYYFAMWHTIYASLVYGVPPERCALCEAEDGEPS